MINEIPGLILLYSRFKVDIAENALEGELHGNFTYLQYQIFNQFSINPTIAGTQINELVQSSAP